MENLNKYKNSKCISFAGIDTDEASFSSYGTLEYDENDNKFKFENAILRNNLSDDISSHKIITNLMAYINSGKPDIREFRNTIRYRGKSTVNVRPEDEDLSRGKIFLVGYNWLKNPAYKVDGWWSSGYMSWRMCGEGRKEPRLVYFKGSFKQRKKGREDITEESAVEGEDFEEC